MKRILILSCILHIIGCISLYAQKNDSIVTDLQEFVVESKSVWIEDDHVVFMPTRKEKNRSNSVETLLRQMNMPYVTIADNVIKDLRGENVSVYINGNEATEVELASFWPKNVIKVEYYSDPSDPKYKGSKSVINFVVANYNIGGVTKLNIYQSLMPYKARYNLSSKLDYKNMSYGVMVYADTYNQREGQLKSENIDIYKNIWYREDYYSEISDKNEISNNSDMYVVKAVVNAIYNNKRNVRMAHSVSLSWEDWDDMNVGLNQWNPEIFKQNNSSSSRYKNALSPRVSGIYSFILNQKLTLFTNWNYSYASIDIRSSNLTSDLPVILNQSSENAHVFGINGSLGYMLNRYNYFQLQFYEDLNIYSIRYSGSYDNHSRQDLSTSRIALLWYWRPRNNFQFNIAPGITIDNRNISNSGHQTTINPYLNLSSNWYQSDKAYLNVYCSYAVASAKASQANEVLQRQSELIWFMGNPSLKERQTFQLGLQQTWMPVSWMTTTLNVAYLDWNIPYARYFASPKDIEGLIMQYVNNSSDKTWRFDLNINSNLFNNCLSINLNPSLMLQRSGNIDYHRSLNRFAISGDISYSIGNVSVDLSYSGVDKVIGDGGHLIQYRPDQWSAGVTYGNGDFYASFKINNIFRRHTYQLSNYEFDNYINQCRTIQLGRNFSLNLSYTFGYGKRVSRTIEIQDTPNIESGAAGSK